MLLSLQEDIPCIQTNALGRASAELFAQWGLLSIFMFDQRY